MRYKPEKIEEIAVKLGVSPKVIEHYLDCREILTHPEAGTRKSKAKVAARFPRDNRP